MTHKSKSADNAQYIPPLPDEHNITIAFYTMLGFIISCVPILIIEVVHALIPSIVLHESVKYVVMGTMILLGWIVGWPVKFYMAAKHGTLRQQARTRAELWATLATFITFPVSLSVLPLFMHGYVVPQLTLTGSDVDALLVGSGVIGFLPALWLSTATYTRVCRNFGYDPKANPPQPDDALARKKKQIPEKLSRLARLWAWLAENFVPLLMLLSVIGFTVMDTRQDEDT